MLKEKATFFKRWPDRDYRTVPKSVTAECSSDHKCSVRGWISWRVYSPQRKTTSTGTASFHLRFQMSEEPKLLLERTDVLSRTVADAL